MSRSSTMQLQRAVRGRAASSAAGFPLLRTVALAASALSLAAGPVAGAQDSCAAPRDGWRNITHQSSDHGRQVNGREAPFDDAALAWSQDVLLQLFRRSAMDAIRSSDYRGKVAEALLRAEQR